MNRKNYKWILLLLAAIGFTGGVKAAETSVADSLRGNAKFNVVAVVLGIIFSGLAFFLIRLDKRVSNLENKTKNNKS